MLTRRCWTSLGAYGLSDAGFRVLNGSSGKVRLALPLLKPHVCYLSQEAPSTSLFSLMSSFIPPPLAIVPLVLVYFLWRIFRNFFLRSAFDNIPGPPSSSWLTGAYAPYTVTEGGTVDLTECLVGNLLKIMDHDAWGYTDDLIQTYGPVAKLHTILGVRSLLALSVPDTNEKP